MLNSDVSYYRQRAADERSLALVATCKKVSAVHAELARRYQALANADEMRNRIVAMEDNRGPAQGK